MTLTRHPTGQDLMCLVCLKPAQDIDHVVNRGMGGSKERDVPENKVPLCRECHDLKTVGRIKTWVEDGVYCWQAVPSKRSPKLGQNTTIRVAVAVSERYKCLVLSAAAEADIRTDAPPSVSVTAPSTKEESDERIPGGVSIRSDMGGSGEFGSLGSDSHPLNPLDEDWRNLPDDQLQALYESAEKRQGLSFLVKCKAVHTFKEKHDWGDAWTEHAYERFGASRRTLYAYANIWAICVTSDTFAPERMAPLTDSRSLMQAIGRRSLADGVVAMEAAVAHYAEYAEPPTVAALAQKLGEEAGEPRERHSCPDCGAEHQVKA